MAKTFIAEIQPSQEVAAPFVVAEKQLRVARNGTPFLTLKLVDKTGEIVGRVWEKAEEASEAVCTKGVVFIRGRSEKYRDEIQIQIQQISPVDLSQIDPADFLPVCSVSEEILLDKLKKIVSHLKSRPLRQLMKLIMADRLLMDRFKRAPAAKAMHHAYLGGLLEHSVAVAALTVKICDQYPDLDRDLLVVGAILHDIGKVDEFAYDLCIDYSDAGRLLGHMVLGLQILDEKVRSLKDFPSEVAIMLQHLILSHHGETSLGAVKLPMTREAFVLHFADDLDAKMNSLTRILAEVREADAAWTAYQPLFQRFFFRGLPPSGEDSILTSMASEEDKAVQLNIWSMEKTKRPGP